MIDVNKKYKTKDGQSVIIEGIDNDPDYPIYGSTYDKRNRKEYNHRWTIEGKYFIDFPYTMDLVEINETNEKIMKIDKNKTYRTRDGREVRIYEILENGHRFPVVGSIVDKEGQIILTAWMIDGSYSSFSSSTDNDLIEYTPDPTESIEFWNRLDTHLRKSIISIDHYKMIDEYNYLLLVCQQKINELK